MAFAGVINIEESKIMCKFTNHLQFDEENFNLKKIILDSCLIPHKDRLLEQLSLHRITLEMTNEIIKKSEELKKEILSFSSPCHSDHRLLN